MMPQDIPESLIKTMDYETRRKNFDQELQERLRESGSMPAAKYLAIVRYLTNKWRV